MSLEVNKYLPMMEMYKGKRVFKSRAVAIIACVYILVPSISIHTPPSIHKVHHASIASVTKDI